MASRKKVDDDKIIQALLLYPTKQMAADSLEITPQTISNKLRNPTFVAKYSEAKSEILRGVIVKLSNATEMALDLIIQSVTDTDIPISIRLQSAKDIVRMNRDFIETDDLARRITLLETSMD